MDEIPLCLQQDNSPFFFQNSALKAHIIYNWAFYMHQFPQEHPGEKNSVNLLATLSKTRYAPARSSHTPSSLFGWSPGAVSGHGWSRNSQCVVLGAGYCMGITWISFLWCGQPLEVKKMVVAPSPAYPLLGPTTLTSFCFPGRVHHLKTPLEKVPWVLLSKSELISIKNPYPVPQNVLGIKTLCK